MAACSFCANTTLENVRFEGGEDFRVQFSLAWWHVPRHSTQHQQQAHLTVRSQPSSPCVPSLQLKTVEDDYG
ncbi:hypothetical protein TYRP_005705 [Tyrophagus putrescentiae]|nr:hypothetical protein TYRP_005705 [Tyrophagus putrescentiae]